MKRKKDPEWRLTTSDICSYKSGIITAERGPHHVVMFLTALRSYDLNHRRISTLIISAIFLTILLGIVAHILIPDTYLQYGAYVLSAFLLVFEIYRGGFHPAPKCLDDVIALCQILSGDIGKNTPVFLKIDVRSGTEKSKLESESVTDIPRGTRLTSIYNDRWFTLRTQLEDKTKLEVLVDDQIKVRKLSRKNPRGKLKVKWRRSNRTNITVSIKRKAIAQGKSAEWVTMTSAMYSEGNAVPKPLNRIIELIMAVLKDSSYDKSMSAVEDRQET
jgi:hypothetical protein